jgi:plasmid stabilization system protein ParE
MKIQILEGAEHDLTKGYYFYEAQERGLGDYFLDTLYSDIDSLQLYAGIHTRYFGYHRVLSKRFPYAIYYQVVTEYVQIWAVLDCRQDPKNILKRLS